VDRSRRFGISVVDRSRRLGISIVGNHTHRRYQDFYQEQAESHRVRVIYDSASVPRYIIFDSPGGESVGSMEGGGEGKRGAGSYLSRLSGIGLSMIGKTVGGIRYFTVSRGVRSIGSPGGRERERIFRGGYPVGTRGGERGV